MRVDRRRTGEDDEEARDDGRKAPDNHINERELVVLRADPLVHHRRLLIELHPRGNGRADDANRHHDGRAVEGQRRADDLPPYLAPVRPCHEAGDEVGEVHRAGRQEDLLNLPVVAPEHDEPHEDSGQGHRDIARHAEDLRGGGHAGELGQSVGPVAQQHAAHDPDGHAHAEALADQVRQPLAGDGAHPGAHLLDDDERHRDRQHDPQQPVAEVATRQRVCGDAAGIVVHVGGDDAGPDDGEQQRQ